MNQLHLYNPNHMESTQLHHHPQSHEIHNPKKKKTAQTSMRSPPVNLIGEAELHGDGRSQCQQSRWRKKKRERERERERSREIDPKKKEKKEKKKRKRER